MVLNLIASKRPRFLFKNRPKWTRDSELGIHFSDDSLPPDFEKRPKWQRRDKTLVESAVNVATSLPFFAVGLATPSSTPRARHYGHSVVGIGLASSAYHAARGPSKKLFRWLDHATIAASAMCFTRALHEQPEKLQQPPPRSLMLASALLLPLKPTLVTLVHAGIMETTFAKRASKDPQLKPAHRLHTAATLVGSSLYLADEVIPHHPFIHAAWHLAAAVGIHTANELLR